MRQLGRGPGNNLTHVQDVCRQAGEPCGDTMGQLDCHTKPPSASRCATVQPDEYAPCNRTSQTVRRFAQTLMMYQRRTFLFHRGGGSKMPTQTGGGYCPCGNSCSGGRSASQKSQNGRSDMQSKVQTRRCRSAA